VNICPEQLHSSTVICCLHQLRLKERHAFLDVERLSSQSFEIEMPVAPYSVEKIIDKETHANALELGLEVAMFDQHPEEVTRQRRHLSATWVYDRAVEAGTEKKHHLSHQLRPS
jgi:hypothetical protein